MAEAQNCISKFVAKELLNKMQINDMKVTNEVVHFLFFQNGIMTQNETNKVRNCTMV